MVQLNLYQFLHGYSTGAVSIEFDLGTGIYLNRLINFGLYLRHVPKVKGYFDARQRTRYP